jgi:exodeoxyribonuclease-5
MVGNMTTDNPSSLGVTREQKEVLRDILAWLANPAESYLTVGGYAGTGKTTLITLLRWLLHQKKPQWRVAFAAYTGKASQLLAAKLKTVGAVYPHDSVSTLHRLVYTPLFSTSKEIVGWERREKTEFDLIIIDEASMVTQDIWRDVLRWGIPVLAVGDHGQLPPIGDSFSLMAEPQLLLQQIHRQVADSPIIKLATMARRDGHIPIGRYGPGVVKFDSQDSAAMSELDAVLQSWRNDQLILVGRNKTRVGLNRTVRQALGHETDEPEAGDQVICLKNHWKFGVYNGLLGKIQRVQRSHEGDQLKLDLTIADDNGIQLYAGPVDPAQFHKTEAVAGSAARLPWTIWDFGYALTVHKAQGSQARKVIVLEERNQHMTDDDWKRWLYTAVTRAQEELILFGSDN